MIELIIFDLDGVLVDSRELHYESLNEALETIDKKFIISREDHLSTYDGLSTTKKLEILNAKKNLPREYFDMIWRLKQEKTFELIKSFKPNIKLINIFKELKKRKYQIYIASNSIYKTVQLFLMSIGVFEYVDYFISNQEVKNCKPSSEIYLRCLIRSNIPCHKTLILEDSHIGRISAINSGCHLLAVENPDDVSLDKILSEIKYIDNMEEKRAKWKGKINVVIPMAGAGSRFEKAGYTFPKPLIDVNGKAMIQVVVENLNLDNAQFIFIVRKEHYDKYNLKHFLQVIAPNCKIIISDGLTQGATCSVLLSKGLINNDEHLLLANSDQFVEWDSNEFLYSMISDGIDGGILTFNSNHPKWSYAKLDERGFVKEVAEKKVISNNATVGIYYWNKGSDFVKYAEKMIEKDRRVNGEFYVCPVFNEAIEDKKKIKLFECKKMWGLGTPEDLKSYLKENFKI